MTGRSDAPRFALYTVKGEAGGAAPSLAAAAAQLGVSGDDLDAAFGVVAIDPRSGLYAVQARSDRVHPADGEYRGPYATPPIAPLGRPKPEGSDEER